MSADGARLSASSNGEGCACGTDLRPHAAAPGRSAAATHVENAMLEIRTLTLSMETVST
jgi:hypothetical protein